MDKPIDTSIQNQFERGLVESKQLFKVVFDYSPAAITVADKNECIVAWNPMTEKMFKMGRADLFNKPVQTLYTPQEWKRIRALNIRKQGMITNIDTQIILKDQTFMDVNASISVLTDAQGEKIGSIAVIYDVTAQKKSENLLKESESKLRIILDNSAAAITMTDDKERIVSWNTYAETMLGMTKEDLYLCPVSALYPPQEWKNIRGLNIRQSGFRHHLETKVLRKDGTVLDVDLSVNIIKDDEGKIVGSVGMLQDITQAKITRELLLQAKIEAEEANNAKSVFLAKMSHEIRTPMNAVIGMLDLTLDTELTEEQKDNLKVARDAADNLLSLINDILDLSRAEAGKVVIEDIELNLPDVVRNVCKGLTVLARNKGIDIIWDIDPRIPKLLVGDSVRLRQVLVNLVNNAVKFTHKGKVQVNVKLAKANTVDAEIVFEVIDNGIGIPQKNLPHLFEVFTEAHNSTARRYGGTGLGLAICKKLVEMMKGQISVESTEGVGSTFRFTIIFGVPANTGSVLKDGEPGNIMTNAAGATSTLQLKILLAEDNVVNQRVASKTLEKFGWSVVCVADGQQALNILSTERFDLILMDDNMPVLDGVSTTQVIRREEKQTGQHVPIIAMTANAMAGDRERYLNQGMDGYVSKPIDRQVLYNEIIKVIQQHTT